MAANNLQALLGKKVTAKRAGWDIPPQGVVKGNDILDPPPWRDDGLPEEVSGILASFRFPGSEFYNGYTSWQVDGESVDPKTVKAQGYNGDPPNRPGDAKYRRQPSDDGGLGHSIDPTELRNDLPKATGLPLPEK